MQRRPGLFAAVILENGIYDMIDHVGVESRNRSGAPIGLFLEDEEKVLATVRVKEIVRAQEIENNRHTIMHTLSLTVPHPHHLSHNQS